MGHDVLSDRMWSVHPTSVPTVMTIRAPTRSFTSGMNLISNNGMESIGLEVAAGISEVIFVPIRRHSYLKASVTHHFWA